VVIVNNDKKMKKEIKLIKEFEYMRNFAELKALSKKSLEQPLSNSEFNRLMELKEKTIGKKIERGLN
jgi:hypothetical protein